MTPLSARRVRAIIETATLATAPTWAETRQWHVVDGDGNVLVTVAPTIGQAVAGLEAWERWTTQSS